MKNTNCEKTWILNQTKPFKFSSSHIQVRFWKEIVLKLCVVYDVWFEDILVFITVSMMVFTAVLS